MESVWRKSCEIAPRDSLKGHVETNTAVIGGGITGLLIAWRLKQRGIDAVVLEAERICSGETENTTAKITAHHGYICSFLLGRYGETAGREYIKANLDAIGEYEKIIKTENIECSFTKCRNFLYSENSPGKLEKEARAAEALGLECEIVSPDLPFPTVGAVMCGGQAMFNPLRFLNAVASSLTVYEKSRVVRADKNTLFTETGTVTAENIVFACHMPFVKFPGVYFARMYLERSYILTVKTSFHTEDMFIGIEDGTLSLRPYDEYLLAGGGAHRCGAARRGTGYAAVKKALDRRLGDYKVVARQSAQDCIPAGKVPYIGRFSASRPNWYVASGFQKWGMTTAMAASKYLCDMISGDNEHKNSIFAPSYPYKNRTKEIASAVGWSIKGLSKEFLTLPPKFTDSMKKESAAVVRRGGKKYGVYKDFAGELHTVNIKCPHLGCQLEWNPNEKSWDCPCHGSRFNFNGDILSGPALNKLIKPIK